MKRKKHRQIRIRLYENDPISEFVNNADSPQDEILRLASIGVRWQRADQDPVGFIALVRQGGDLPTQSSAPSLTPIQPSAISGNLVPTAVVAEVPQEERFAVDESLMPTDFFLGDGR